VRISALKRNLGLICLVLAGFAAVGCQKKPATPAAGAGMQGLPVQTAAVTLSPVAQSSEYVATIKSRRSATIEPQVQGMLTQIHVKSGDHVTAGELLMEIDPRMQMATVASARATERQKKAVFDYNTVEVERQRKLFEAGVTSHDAYDQAAQAYDNSKADYESAVELRKTQEEQLAYYTIRAPFEGVVGDIPVHVGDYVSSTTMLTTVDENKDLEAYVYVPTERAAQVRMGLGVDLIDTNEKLIEKTNIDFISPEVDSTLQGILVKAPVHGACHLEHYAHGSNPGARGHAPGRTEFCLCRPAAERPLVGAAGAGHAGRYGGQQLFHHFGIEGRRQGCRFQHTVPGQQYAGDSAARRLKRN
jgi:RND family efflux transporter MFP subunit